MIRRILGPPVLTRAEVAQVLGVHPSTVTRWAAAGLLPCLRTPSGERRYRRCAVEALLNQPGTGQRAYRKAGRANSRTIAEEGAALRSSPQVLSLVRRQGQYPVGDLRPWRRDRGWFLNGRSGPDDACGDRAANRRTG
jgi:excisionase family DNA binding protein